MLQKSWKKENKDRFVRQINAEQAQKYDMLKVSDQSRIHSQYRCNTVDAQRPVYGKLNWLIRQMLDSYTIKMIKHLGVLWFVNLD